MAKGDYILNIASPYINYKDTFDLKRLYFVLQDFFVEEGYLDDYGTQDFLENYYEEQRLPTMKHVFFKWHGETTAPGGSQFYKYILDMDIKCFGLKDVDIVRNNNKIRCQQGEIQIRLFGKLHVDYKGNFKNSFLSLFKERFFKVIMKKEIEYHMVKVLDDVQKLELAIKDHLHLHNFKATHEPYLERF